MILWNSSLLMISLSLGASYGSNAYWIPGPTPIRSECLIKEAFKLEDKCVHIEPTKLSWLAAQEFCYQLGGGHLLQITSGNLYFGVVQAIKERGFGSNSFFVGGARVNNQEGWKWVTQNTPIHETFWTVSIVNGKIVKEPQAVGNQGKHCALLDVERSHFMNVAECDRQQSFICEFTDGQQRDPYKPPQKVWGLGTFFSAVDESTPANELYCEAGWTLFEAEESCYLIEEEAVSFYEAKDSCKRQNASLVTISSEEEDVFLADLAQNHSSLLTGFIRISPGEYHWVSGETSEYTNWPVGEPGTFYEGIASCMEITPDGWKSVYCVLPNMYICEMDAMNEGDPTYFEVEASVDEVEA